MESHKYFLVFLFLLSACGGSPTVTSEPKYEKCIQYSLTNIDHNTIYCLSKISPTPDFITNPSTMRQINITDRATVNLDNTQAGFLHLYFYRDATHVNEIGKLVVYDSNQLIMNVCKINLHNEGHYNQNNYIVKKIGSVKATMEGKIQSSVSPTDISATVLSNSNISQVWLGPNEFNLATIGSNQFYHLCFYQAREDHSPVDGHTYYHTDNDKFYGKIILLNTNSSYIQVEYINFYDQ